MTFYDKYQKELDKLDSKDVLFTKSQAAKLIDLTPRSVHFYTDEGLVIPEINPKGKGTNRKYSRLNLYELLLIKELARNNVSIKDIRTVMNRLRGGKKLLGRGKEVMILYDNKSDEGSMMVTSADEYNYVKVGMAERSSALVIDLSSLRIKAARLV